MKFPEYSCPYIDKILELVAKHEHELGPDAEKLIKYAEIVRAINQELRERLFEKL